MIVNGSHSRDEAVTSGVPQGSVLGPVLFLIFINDLPEVINAAVRIFADDDTKIFQPINERADQQKLQENLGRLEEWADTWKMPFHPEKCKVMHIGKEIEQFRYTKLANGYSVPLEYTDEEKDLGVIVDNSLCFEQHCEAAINKANRILSVIRRSFKYIDREVLLTLYKSLVRPHLEYGNTIWNPTLKKVIRSDEAVQRRATKMIPDLTELSYPERLKQLRLPSLVYRRHRGDMIQTYKIMHHKYDLDEKQFFKTPTDGRTRGHSYKLFKERSETAVRRNFFSRRVIDLWNELPESVVSAKDVDVFKQRLDSHWLNRDWLYDFEAIEN